MLAMMGTIPRMSEGRLPPGLAAATRIDDRLAPFHEEFNRDGRWD